MNKNDPTNYRANHSDEQWAKRHGDALAFSRGFEVPIVYMLTGIHHYRTMHKDRYESDVLDDGVIGEGLKEMAAGLRTLLHGESGRLDCGTIDAYLHAIVGDES